MALSYTDTLIAVADDCPVAAAVVPAARGGKRTVAVIQHELLAEQPYVYTMEDVLFESWLQRQEPKPRPEAELAQLRGAFFARPQACLRTSPLAKQYGWGFVFDAQGRVALCPMESATYSELLRGDRVRVVKAMRTSRGG